MGAEKAEILVKKLIYKYKFMLFVEKEHGLVIIYQILQDAF